MSSLTFLNYIGGEFLDAHFKNTLPVVNPAKGEVYAHCPSSTAEDVKKAIQCAKSAFNHWSEIVAHERAEFLIKIADEIEKRLEEFAQAETLDTGKPITVSRTVDIPRAIQNFRFFADQLLTHKKEYYKNEGYHHEVQRSALGVVVCIAPWNLPLYLLTWKIAPALAYGNTVLAKPSEVTPYTAFLLSEICQKVGLPNGVLNIIHGRGSDLGESLCTHPSVKAVSFTGSTQTGRKIAISCAPFFKKVSLEMGGKNPCILFQDLDIEKNISDIARSLFANQGQVCLCSSRVYIEKPIYEKVKSKLLQYAQEWKCGNPLDENTKSGSIVSKEHYEKILNCIKKAKNEGGKILCGGEPQKLNPPYEKGYFIPPTLIEGLPINCETNQEEVFGPVATLQPFESEDEVVEFANATAYGLSASVWTRDFEKAMRVSKKIQCGVLWINSWMKRDLRTPFGGVKNSGLGREGGEDVYRFFTESKSITYKDNEDEE